MNDELHHLRSEQARQSEELQAVRTMHIEVLKSVGELCTKLGILDTLVEKSNERFEEMRATLREHGGQIKILEHNQAANAYFIDLVKSINKWVVIASISAVGALACAFYVLIKSSGQLS